MDFRIYQPLRDKDFISVAATYNSNRPYFYESSSLAQFAKYGYTTDYSYGPMGDSGFGNPAYYHQYFDDFDNALGATGLYTLTAASGSIVHSAGDGGLAL